MDEKLDVMVLKTLREQKAQEIAIKIDREVITSMDLMMLDLLISMVKLLEKNQR